MLFMPLSVVALSRVQAEVAGAASSLLNTGQQVGGSIGLAVLGTVAWTAVANSVRSQAARRGQDRPPAHPPPGDAGRDLPARARDRVLPRVRDGSRDPAARPDRHHYRDPGTACDLAGTHGPTTT